MRYRLITEDRVWNDPDKTEDWNICIQVKRWYGWETLEEYRPYNFAQAIKDLDMQKRINKI